MKKINLAKIIWITMIFLGLIIILIAVMDYKINFEFKIKNKIYFYDCSGTLCVTEVKDDDHLLYSTYECGYEECPVFKSEINDTYAILETQNDNVLFDYRNGKIISLNYNNYQLLTNNYFIVTKEKKQGIINLNNELLVPLEYDQLGHNKDGYLIGYNLNYIIAKKNDKYGIISIKNNTIIEDFIHEETTINDLLKIIENKEKNY